MQEAPAESIDARRQRSIAIGQHIPGSVGDNVLEQRLGADWREGNEPLDRSVACCRLDVGGHVRKEAAPQCRGLLQG